ncbi:hypothetical protein AGDE_16997 [Angomonas deanei]|nr:hypothetical protein AGDE_16997 [Angomonas deanei]|eukprot:EPY15722.1 hypothetical protein AGDE_16997 [Angomonas deanei]
MVSKLTVGGGASATTSKVFCEGGLADIVVGSLHAGRLGFLSVSRVFWTSGKKMWRKDKKYCPLKRNQQHDVTDRQI